MHPDLSFEQAPPISVPFRFFLAAPLFGVVAGLLLAWVGAEAFASRWTPAALALTHLVVTGFMLQAMCGALLQFVPVAAGGNVWRPTWVVALVQPLLAAGTFLLTLAFLTGRSGLFLAAVLLFSIALGSFIVVVGLALALTPAQGPTLRALRFAIAGLLVTAVLGAVLATGLGNGRNWPLAEITQVHVGWGLGGWALMLVMGVSYMVVPMFQITPPYPLPLARNLPPLLFAVLLLWSLQLTGTAAPWQAFVLLAGLALTAVFAAATLRLQSLRRRKISDPTLVLFRVAMLSLLAILLSVLWFTLAEDIGADPRAALWIGVLALCGTFTSVICGMLYKIVPFLSWLHLQRLGGMAPPPNMRQMIAEKAMRGQMLTHCAAVAVLLAAVVMPDLARLGGILFAVSCGWLGLNLASGVRAYCRFRDRILASDEGSSP